MVENSCFVKENYFQNLRKKKKLLLYLRGGNLIKRNKSKCLQQQG